MMDWIKIRNRRLIAAIWREAMFQNRHAKADLRGTHNEWKFWEGLLAATPAGEADESDLDDEPLPDTSGNNS
jgi:hypothetical protein